MLCKDVKKNAMHIPASVCINYEESGLKLYGLAGEAGPREALHQCKYNGYEDSADAHQKMAIMG